MLILTFLNDGTASPRDLYGHYDYKILMNRTVLAEGRVEDHERTKGWRELVRRVVEEDRIKENS